MRPLLYKLRLLVLAMLAASALACPRAEPVQSLAEPAVEQAVAAVPRTFEASQAAGRAAAPELVARYEAMPTRADPQYLPILEALQALPAGSADPRGEELLHAALALTLASERSQAESAELRALYDETFARLLADWQAQLVRDGEALQSRAELACLHRTALRELTRDLMRDTNAVAVLRARDVVKYGQGTGPTCAQLYEREMAKPGASPEAAWTNIIGTAQRHNKEVSDTLRK